MNSNANATFALTITTADGDQIMLKAHSDKNMLEKFLKHGGMSREDIAGVLLKMYPDTLPELAPEAKPTSTEPASEAKPAFTEPAPETPTRWADSVPTFAEASSSAPAPALKPEPELFREIPSDDPEIETHVFFTQKILRTLKELANMGEYNFGVNNKIFTLKGEDHTIRIAFVVKNWINIIWSKGTPVCKWCLLKRCTCSNDPTFHHYDKKSPIWKLLFKINKNMKLKKFKILFRACYIDHHEPQPEPQPDNPMLSDYLPEEVQDQDE